MWTEQVELNMDKGGQTRCQREDRVCLAGGEEDARHFQGGGRDGQRFTGLWGKNSLVRSFMLTINSN